MPGLPGPPLRLVCPPQHVSTAGIVPAAPTAAKMCPSPLLVSLGASLLDFGPKMLRWNGPKGQSSPPVVPRLCLGASMHGEAAARACSSCPWAPGFGILVPIRKTEYKILLKSQGTAELQYGPQSAEVPVWASFPCQRVCLPRCQPKALQNPRGSS